MTSPSYWRAFAVHAFTASGAACALMALLAGLERQFETAFLWLGLAFVIDAVDGTFARRVDVKTNAPLISGETLDVCVDYLTYVFIPVILLRAGDYLPGALGLVLASLILMSSLYHFSDLGSKSADNFFFCSPALWNIVAFYVFVLAPPVWLAWLVIAAGIATTFVRLKWVHPLRVETYRPFTLATTAAWSLAAGAVTITGFPGTPSLQFVLLAVVGYWFYLSFKLGFDRR